MINRTVASALLVAAVAVLGVGHALAREKTLGTFGAWQTFMQTEGGQQVCYMVATANNPPVISPVKAPVKGRHVKAKRGQPYIMITHRPIEASLDVFSYGAGAMLDTRRGATLRLGKNSFDLFAVRDTAWARDALTDHKIARALRILSLKPKAILGVHAYPEHKGDRLFADTFSLNGTDAAYHAIGKACGVTVTPLPHQTPARQKARLKSNNSKR